MTAGSRRRAGRVPASPSSAGRSGSASGRHSGKKPSTSTLLHLAAGQFALDRAADDLAAAAEHRDRGAIVDFGVGEESSPSPCRSACAELQHLAGVELRALARRRPAAAVVRSARSMLSPPSRR